MSIIELIHNLSLLIALTAVSGIVIQNKSRSKYRDAVEQGFLFGFVAIIGMYYPMPFSEGIFFDGRSVILSLCALFFGPAAAIISGGMSLVMRFFQGGSGIVMGSAVILTSSLTGLIFHYKIFRIKKDVSFVQLIAAGLTVHAIMVILMFSLPGESAFEVINSIALAVILLYPAATVILGIIIRENIRSRQYISELRESEEKFRNLAENTSIAIAIYQNDKWVYANPVSTEMTGFANEELLNMKFWDFVHPEDRDKVMQLGKARQAGKNPEKSYEFRIRTKDQKEKTVWLSGSSTTFNRKPAGLITVMDVTERKKAEAKLVELQDIIHRSRSVAFTWINKPGWPVQFVTDNVFELTGYSAEEFMTGTVSYESIIHQEDKEYVSYEVNKNSDDGIKEFIHKGYRIITKSGAVKWISDFTSVIRDKEGNVLFYKGVIEDITDKKSAEEDLAESEEKFRAIFDNANDAIGLHKLTPDGISGYVDINRTACEILGYTKDELMKIDPLSIFPEGFEKNMAFLFEELLKTKQIKFVSEHITKDGSSFPVEIKGSLFELKGEPYFLSVARDISVMVEAEQIMRSVNKELDILTEELRRSNQDLENFAYIVSHDLQEPLRMVASFTQLLESKFGDSLNEEARKYIKFAVDGVIKMKSLINGLLNFSRITTQGDEFKNIDMNRAVESVVELFSSKLKELNGSVNISKLPEIKGDEVQIRQLFQNLIGNALKFRKEDVPPEIEISAEEINGEREFRIKDNGIGIDDKYKEMIFDMFKKVHSADKYEGTGIGLAFCKQIIKRHKGSIRVESVPGEGSTFIFRLPSV